MVNTDKVYLMTQAAIFEQKEKNNALKVVTYRRKDYILSHVLLVMLSASVAYFVLVAAVMFMVIMAYEQIVLNVGEMVLIIAGVLLGYIVLLIVYYMVSHKYYGEKHVKARQDVRKYLAILKAIQEMEQ